MGKQKCSKCGVGFATSFVDGTLYCDNCKPKPACTCGCSKQPDAFNVSAALKAINEQPSEKKSWWRRINDWFINRYANYGGPHI